MNPGQPRVHIYLPPELNAHQIWCKLICFMKMLFSPSDHAEAKLVKKKLSDAGIRCAVRKLPADLFGVAPDPELWIENEHDILKALKLLGTRRLRQMTVIFPTLQPR